jgi:predicted RND superfamily exporter protein
VLATGLPLLEARLSGIVAAERTRVVPWLVGVLLLVASVVYRSVALGAATLLPALGAIVWTGGIVALCGYRLDPIGSLLDPVLLTIGVASSVHFVENYRRGRCDGLDPPAAAAYEGKSQLQPGFLAMATTMVGLLSLCTSSIPAVVDFGVRSTFGIALAHVFTFLLLPAWLPFAARTAPAADSSRRIAGPWPAATSRWRTGLLAAMVAITAFTAAGLPRLHADNDPLALLPADDPVRRDHTQLVSLLGGVEVFHLLAPERSPAPTLLVCCRSSPQYTHCPAPPGWRGRPTAMRKATSPSRSCSVRRAAPCAHRGSTRSTARRGRSVSTPSLSPARPSRSLGTPSR